MMPTLSRRPTPSSETPRAIMNLTTIRRSAEEENGASTQTGKEAPVSETNSGSRRRFPFKNLDINSPPAVSSARKKRSSFGGGGSRKGPPKRDGGSSSPNASPLKRAGSSSAMSDETRTTATTVPSAEPTGAPSEAAAPSLAQTQTDDDDVASIFRSRTADAQSSIWSGELGSMLSLKRANPIYDSDSEDDVDDSLSSPFKRLRHGDDSSGSLEDVRDPEDDSSERSLSHSASLIHSQHSFFLPESLWKTSDFGQVTDDDNDNEEESPSVFWTDRVADDDAGGFAIMQSASVLSAE